MTLPNFLLIGAARCGTTSMYNHLREHPDIFMSSPKELNYFVNSDLLTEALPPEASIVVRSLENYQLYFASVTTERAIGEASPSYLFFPACARRILAILGRVKIVVHLRHPVDRAYSHFRLRRYQGSEPEADFIKAFQSEDLRIEETGERYYWAYKSGSIYAPRLAKFLEVFGVDNVHINIFDDFVNNPLHITQQTYRFLKVDPTFEADTNKVHYPSLLGFKYRFKLHRKPPFVRMRKRRVYPPELPATVRKRLTTLYTEDIKATQELTKRDLSKWLEGA